MPLAEKEREYANKLAKLIQVPTVSYADDTVFAEFRKAVEEEFPLVSKNLERVIVYDNALLFRWKGKSGAKPLVYMGHQDVVPATEASWQYPPFSGTVADGKVWGRGAMDCKGTLFAQLQAVEELIEEGYVPFHDVYIASSDCEEAAGLGAVKIKEYLRNSGIKPFIVLDEGGAIAEEAFDGMIKPYCMVGVYEKGFANVKFIARSLGGHSSTPPKNSPVVRLSRFVAEVERKDPFRKKMDGVTMAMILALAPGVKGGLGFVMRNIKIFKPIVTKLLPKINAFGNALLATTIAFTMTKAADAPNIIPTEAYVVGNLRFSRHQGSKESFAVIKKIADRYGLEMEITECRDASETTDIKGEGFRLVEESLKEHFPAYGTAPYVILGGTDCRHFEDICKNCIRFTPLRLSKEQLEAMHAANENVTVKYLADAVSFYKYLIKKNI